MSKLTFWSADVSGLGSMDGMVNSHAETYIMGADTKVLITMPEVICKKRQTETRTELIAAQVKQSACRNTTTGKIIPLT